ncbi:hypothetical protein [Novosphingobium sp.]|uniref:hypothetical protein n=1 Tax=Novosphingobium sp. TaxID=1874826 RepID=UPI0028AD4F92|nr:hypothetical protein [Novosphingobium sp.]
MKRVRGSEHGFRPLAPRLLQPCLEAIDASPCKLGDVILMQALDPGLEFLDMFTQLVVPPLVDGRLLTVRESKYPVETEWLNGHGILHHRRTLGIRTTFRPFVADIAPQRVKQF